MGRRNKQSKSEDLPIITGFAVCGEQAANRYDTLIKEFSVLSLSYAAKSTSLI